MNILHICAQFDSGGVEQVVWNYVSELTEKDVKFYMVKHRSGVGLIEKRLREHGCTVGYVISKSKNPFLYVWELRKFMKRNQIDAVHCHQGYASFCALLIAASCGIRKRIAHAHTAFEPENWKRTCYRKFCTLLTKASASDLCACGLSSGHWMWGGGFSVLPNALHTGQYRFSSQLRRSKRKELGISEEFVVGCVSRLAPGKNHLFLLEIMKEFRLLNQNAVLYLVGDGSCRKEIEDHRKKMGMESYVHLLGNREDVSELLNAMDAFVLPTKFEGLGLCFIEAQINGLPVFAAEGAVPPETKLTSSMQFLPVCSTPKEWADQAAGVSRHSLTPEEEMRIQQYEITVQSQRLLRLYCEGDRS